MVQHRNKRRGHSGVSAPQSQRTRLVAALSAGGQELTDELSALAAEDDDGSLPAEAREFFLSASWDAEEQLALLGLCSQHGVPALFTGDLLTGDDSGRPLARDLMFHLGDAVLEVVRRIPAGVVAPLPHSGVPVSVAEWQNVPGEEEQARILNRKRAVHGSEVRINGEPLLVVRLAGVMRVLPETDVLGMTRGAKLIAGEILH